MDFPHEGGRPPNYKCDKCGKPMERWHEPCELVTVKEYTTESIDDETTQIKKWKLGYREEGYFVEIEGDRLFSVLRIFLLARRRLPKGKNS